jgi:protein-tyrosine-phosphatase
MPPATSRAGVCSSISHDVYAILRQRIDLENAVIARKLQLRGYRETDLVYTMDKQTLRRLLQCVEGSRED